jgi:hypothetical protein
MLIDEGWPVSTVGAAAGAAADVAADVADVADVAGVEAAGADVALAAGAGGVLEHAASSGKLAAMAAAPKVCFKKERRDFSNDCMLLSIVGCGQRGVKRSASCTNQVIVRTL